MEHYKIEIDGGKFNGAHRYYSTKKGALIAASKISKDYNEEVFIEIYRLDEKYRKTLIDLKVK